MRFRSLPSTADRGTRLALETLEHRTLLSADGLTIGLQPSMELEHSTRYETVQDAPAVSTGDANRDGLFDQRDLVQVSVSAKYLTAESASWSEGDWNGDHVFDPSDLVAALQGGHYSSQSYSAHADNLAATVNGDGLASMVATADETFFGGLFFEGDTFTDNHFRIKAKVYADGSASGTAFFDFGQELSAKWGAESTKLKGKIETGTVSEDGTVVLQGLSYEKDFAPGVVFKETTPFEIVVDPAGMATLRWCELPALALEITEGHVAVN